MKGIREGRVGAYLLRHTLILFPGLLSLTGLSLVDVYFVGKLGAEALSAISFAAPVFLLGLSVLMGLGTGITAVLSQRIGGGESPGETGKLIFSSWLLAGATGLLLALSGWGLHAFIFSWLGADAYMLTLLTPYMEVIYGCFVVIALLIGVLSGVRAFGENRLPALVMGLVVVMNAVLDPVLILGWGPVPALGLAGAAWATLVALLLGLLLSMAGMWRRGGFVGSFEMRGPAIRSMLHIALPIAATRTLLPLSSAMVIGLLSGFGHEVVAAYGVGYRLDVTLSMFMIALSSVLAPFVGQNFGAGDLERLRKGIGWSVKAALGYGIGISVLLMLNREALARIVATDPEVVHSLSLYFLLVPWGYGLAGLLVLATSVLNVLERPYWAAAISLSHLFALYLPMAWMGSRLASLELVFLAYPVATGLACAGAWIGVGKRISGLNFAKKF